MGKMQAESLAELLNVAMEAGSEHGATTIADEVVISRPPAFAA
jgi:hypothetical protein